MNIRSFATKNRVRNGRSPARQPRGVAKKTASIDPRIDASSEFDAAAWTQLLSEQRLRIARAAGVDPSRVKIQIGH